MTCEELMQLIPELVDGTLPPEQLTEAEATLPQCPDCQRELTIARQVRTFLLQLQTENVQLQLPADFEARLLARLRQHEGYLDLLDLSSKSFVLWLVELIKLLGGLVEQASTKPSESTLRG